MGQVGGFLYGSRIPAMTVPGLLPVFIPMFLLVVWWDLAEIFYGQALVKLEASPKELLSNILTEVYERRTGLRVSRSKMAYTASFALNVDCSSEAIQNGSSIG